MKILFFLYYILFQCFIGKRLSLYCTLIYILQKLLENLQYPPCLVILLRFHVILDFYLLISWMCTLGLSLDYIMRQQYQLYFHHCLSTLMLVAVSIVEGLMNIFPNSVWFSLMSDGLSSFEKNPWIHFNGHI